MPDFFEKESFVSNEKSQLRIIPKKGFSQGDGLWFQDAKHDAKSVMKSGSQTNDWTTNVELKLDMELVPKDPEFVVKETYASNSDFSERLIGFLDKYLRKYKNINVQKLFENKKKDKRVGLNYDVEKRDTFLAVVSTIRDPYSNEISSRLCEITESKNTIQKIHTKYK